MKASCGARRIKPECAGASTNLPYPCLSIICKISSLFPSRSQSSQHILNIALCRPALCLSPPHLSYFLNICNSTPFPASTPFSSLEVRCHRMIPSYVKCIRFATRMEGSLRELACYCTRPRPRPPSEGLPRAYCSIKPTALVATNESWYSGMTVTLMGHVSCT